MQDDALPSVALFVRRRAALRLDVLPFLTGYALASVAYLSQPTLEVAATYATPALVGANQLNMWETLRTFLVKNNLSVDLRHLSEAQSLALMCALFVSLHVLGGRSLLRTIFTMVWMYVAGVLLVVISRRKTK